MSRQRSKPADRSGRIKGILHGRRWNSSFDQKSWFVLTRDQDQDSWQASKHCEVALPKLTALRLAWGLEDDLLENHPNRYIAVGRAKPGHATRATFQLRPNTLVLTWKPLGAPMLQSGYQPARGYKRCLPWMMSVQEQVVNGLPDWQPCSGRNGKTVRGVDLIHIREHAKRILSELEAIYPNKVLALVTVLDFRLRNFEKFIQFP